MDLKIKNYLGIAGMIGILLVSFATWRYTSSYDRSITPGAYRTFSASGEGKIVVIPDVAQFTFKVLTEGGKNLATLEEANTTKTNTAIDYLKNNGVDSKDIKTQNYDIQPRYEYSNCGLYGSTVCPPPSITGYTITNTVEVKVRDLKKVGDILSGVVDSGANGVYGLQFTLDNPDSAKAQARKEAMDIAKEKAKQIAKDAGFRVGELTNIQINDGSDYYPPYTYGMGGDSIMKESSVASAPRIEAGSQDVKVTVTLTYEIK